MGSPWMSQSHRQTEHRKMHVSLTLLCISVLAFVSLTTSRPSIPINLERIKTQAMTTVVRIKEIIKNDFPMSHKIDFGSEADSIQGLTSILARLGNLKVKLSLASTVLQPVQGDMDTLLSHLIKVADSQGCPIPGSPLHMAETDFPINSTYRSMINLQRYLEKLCLDMDKLKTC